MSALRESSGRRLSVLDEVLRAQARYRAWRRLRRAGLAGALLLLTVLVSLWAGPASPPAHKVWPGSTLVESVPVGAEPHAAPCAVRRLLLSQQPDGYAGGVLLRQTGKPRHGDGEEGEAPRRRDHRPGVVSEQTRQGTGSSFAAYPRRSTPRSESLALPAPGRPPRSARPAGSYDVDAAFMSFQPRESGIHAVWSGAGEASVTKVRFRCVRLAINAFRALRDIPAPLMAVAARSWPGSLIARQPQ